MPYARNSPTQRKLTFITQKGICHYCRNPIPYEKWTLDHRVPVSRGGGNHHFNKVGCCGTCNRHKANLTIDEFETCFMLSKKGRIIFDHVKRKALIRKVNGHEVAI